MDEAQYGTVTGDDSPEITAHACDYCGVFEVDPLSGIEAVPEESLDVTMKYRGSRVLRGSRNKCEFFKWAIKGLSKAQESSEDGPPLSSDDSDGWMLYVVIWGTQMEGTFKMNYVSVNWDFLGGIRHFIAGLQVLTRPSDPASVFVPGRPLHCNLGSSEAFAWANARLLRCSNSHPECRRSEGSLLPLRVIRIKDHGESFQLRLTRCHIPESYAALSYCWGGDQPVKLTSDTIEAYSIDIPVHDLPRTLLDAVIATRKLGLSYLWIDCICINQDDGLEKSIEISKMPDIYAGAYVTLSATRSATANEGFLHDLHRPEPGQVCFRLPYACPNGLLGSIILFDSSDWDPHPIDSRAWTLQEYVFSRRVIKFSVCQLHWTCQTADSFQQAQQDGATTAPYDWSGHLNEMVSIHRFVSQVPKDEQDWMQVVDAYSRRALSKSEDKLLAISGIAKKWAEATGDQYLAGLWRRDLPFGLLWVSDSPEVERPYYRAPSWSWASIDNEINVYMKHELAVAELLILGHQIQTAHQQAPFGAVASGKLVVHGRLRAMLFIQSSKTEQLWSRDIIPVEQRFMNVWPDTKTMDRHPRSLPAYCLQVCKYNAQTGGGPYELILTSQDDINFERIGMFSYDEWRHEGPQGSEVTGLSGNQSMTEEQRTFFEGCELRTITLI